MEGGGFGEGARGEEGEEGLSVLDLFFGGCFGDEGLER